MNNFSTRCTALLVISLFCNLHGAAGSSYMSYPLQLLGDYYVAAKKGVENMSGTRSSEYCTDASQGTPQLYLKLAAQTELTMSENDPLKKVAYKELLKSEQFQMDLQRCQKRAWFDFQHALSSLKDNKTEFAVKLLATNSLFLSPLLSFYLYKCLELEDIVRNNSGSNCLVPIRSNDQYGYLEWATKLFSEEALSTKDLTNCVNKTKSAISVDGIWAKVTRWFGKFDYEQYLKPKEEGEKSLAVYQNFLAQIMLTFKIGKTTGAARKKNDLISLVQNPDFDQVYNQIRERNNALNKTYIELLTADPSMDVCKIFEYHWQNTAPLLALLISDIIHENKQPQGCILPSIFTTAKEQHIQPTGKFISLFVKGLDIEQREQLITNKNTIMDSISANNADNREDDAHNVYAFIAKDQIKPEENLLFKLLMPIAQAKRISHIFDLIEHPHTSLDEHETQAQAASSEPIPSAEPAQNPASIDLVLAIDLPPSSSGSGSAELRSAGDSDDEK